MSALLDINIRRSCKELKLLSEHIGKTSDSRNKYHGILESFGEVFEYIYAPKINEELLKTSAANLLNKAQRLNDSSENLDIKQMSTQFATRIKGLKTNDVPLFIDSLKKADINSFVALLKQEVQLSLGADPSDAVLKRKEAAEAERKRKETEEAERRRKEAEEAERQRKEAAEAERRRKEAEEAERRRKEAADAERRRKEAAARRLAEERLRREARRKRNARIIRNLVIFAMAAVAIWCFWLKDLFAGTQQPYSYVYVENLTFRSSPDTESDDNAIELLSYGTPVQLLDSIDEDWSKIKVNGKTGYVYSFYLMDRENFQMLDSIWDLDPDVRQLVPTAIYRKALVDFIKRDSLDAQWKLYNQPDRGYNNVSYPMLVNGYDIIPDFAFLLKDKYSGRRVAVLYSVDAESEPVFIHSEKAQDFPVLKRVTYKRKRNRYNFEYVTSKTKVNNKQLVPDENYQFSSVNSSRDIRHNVGKSNNFKQPTDSKPSKSSYSDENQTEMDGTQNSSAETSTSLEKEVHPISEENVKSDDNNTDNTIYDSKEQNMSCRHGEFSYACLRVNA